MKRILSFCLLSIAMLASFSVGAMTINAFELVAEIDVSPLAYAIAPALTLVTAFYNPGIENALFCIPTVGILHDPCQENAPGIELYGYFFVHDDVQTWPTMPVSPTNPGDTKILTGDYVFKSGKQMYPLYITPDTGEIKGTMQGERDCRSFKNHIEGFTPGMNNKQKEFADYLKNANIIVIHKDKAGVMHQVGRQGLPAYCETAEIYTGKDATGKRGIDMLISVTESTTPMTYTGILQLTPAP